MSTARYPQTDDLIESVNETMQILLHCYTIKYRFDRVSQLPMIEFYYNCYINEASKHYPLEVSYGFQPTTFAHRLLPTGAPALVTERLTELASVRDVVHTIPALS